MTLTPLRPALDNLAYVDASVILAIEFEERGWEALNRRLSSFTAVVSSNLLEAEVRASFLREGRSFSYDILARIAWVFPDRPLSPEIAMALAAGYLRGADLWHVATALYVDNTQSSLTFITADHRQSAVATALGFQT